MHWFAAANCAPGDEPFTVRAVERHLRMAKRLRPIANATQALLLLDHFLGPKHCLSNSTVLDHATRPALRASRCRL